MNSTNLALKNEFDTFAVPEWDYIITELSNVFRLTKEETERLYSSNTAKLIAAIPFAAGCKEPERTAIAHLCIYEAEILGFQKYFAHLPSDDSDIFNRLRCISDFDGGNKEVIDHGMSLLALIMLEGYNKSKTEDKKNGIYNPLTSQAWDYISIKQLLLSRILEIDCPELDSYFIPPKLNWD